MTHTNPQNREEKMKRLLYILTAALVASACGEEKNEVFYTISYPIVEVGAEVTIETTESGEGTGGGSGSGTEDETGDGTEEDGQTEDPTVEEIKAEIIAAAPVAAGGSYTLYFSTYNAGRLEVMAAADAAMAAGVFGKEPGQSSIEFIYSGRDYVCTVSSYTDSEGVRKVLLAVDLTEEYRKLHPEVNITKAERLEYTSTNAY